jgi:transposase
MPENLSLGFLPPYSPELNPIERLWLYLRDNRLSHCVFQTVSASSQFQASQQLSMIPSVL